MSQPQQTELSAAERQVYDRQLRVWGHETQQKLRHSKVLIVGCTGLAAEIAKNIVLAGVGSVTLVDDTACTERASGNFLITHDASQDQTVSQASVATLQEMNPMVTVTAAPGHPENYVTAATAAKQNAVILIGQSGDVVRAADMACTEAGVPLIAACCRSMAGWAFANLHTHNYAIEKEEREDGSISKTTEQRQMKGVAWEAMLAVPPPKRNPKRMSALMPVVQACAKFEAAQGRAASIADAQTLQSVLSSEEWVLESYLGQGEEMPALNAIVGGVVSNDIIKIVAAKGEPMINNLFVYSLLDGTGWVERLE